VRRAGSVRGRIASLSRVGGLLIALLAGHASNVPAGKAATANSPYALAVERYAGGDSGGASRLLASLDPRRLSGEARDYAAHLRLLSDGRRRSFLLKGAVLLHTDAALARRAAGDPSGTNAHLELALLHAGLADVFPRDAGLQSFVRRWYLAAALDRHRFLEVEGAEALLQDGLRRFPADPEMHLALGSLEETRAGSGAPERLREAEKEHRAALGADGSLVEARLRRGRVLIQLGQTAEARAEITEALRTAHDPAHRYLGLLFQGRLLERSSEFTEAVRSYREAAALFPEAQAARMALGHALDHLGNIRDSSAELRRAVVDGAPLFERPDPWAAYFYGQSSRAESLLATLRGEVHP